MIIASSRNRYGEVITIERDINQWGLRVGRTPDLQSMFPVPPGFYYDAVLQPCGRHSLLLLGVAGGSAAHVGYAAGYSRIVGIESDPEMIRLGNIYFNLSAVMDKIVYGDAYKFEDWRKLGWFDKYSCILFDAYNAEQFSRRATESIFLRFMYSRLRPGGLLAINCPRQQAVDSFTRAISNEGLSCEWKTYKSNRVALLPK